MFENDKVNSLDSRSNRKLSKNLSILYPRLMQIYHIHLNVKSTGLFEVPALRAIKAGNIEVID